MKADTEPEHGLGPGAEATVTASVAKDCANKRPRSRQLRHGPVSKITEELVRRVSDRVAKGIPIHTALGCERVTEAAYRRQLQRHPELKVIQEEAKAQFLDKTFEMILSRPGPLVKWFLERRHSDIFAAPMAAMAAMAAPSASNNNNNSPAQGAAAPVPEKPTETIRGVHQEDLEEARRSALKL